MHNKRLPQSFKKAFTLVELLVVMVIIGILIGLAIFGLSTAQKGGRDTSRKNDVRNIVTAMESYASKNNGSYPAASTVTITNGVFTITGGQVDPLILKSAGVTGSVTFSGTAVTCTTAATANSTTIKLDIANSGYTLCSNLENDPNGFNQSRGGNN